MSSSRSTKRCAAAAAGFGMVLASFAGAAASATAATAATAVTHHRSPSAGRHALPARHVTPAIEPSASPVTATISAPVDIALATAQAGTPTTLPTVTIDDSGVIATTDVVTLALVSSPSGFGVAATVPTIGVTGTGVTVSPATVDTGAGTIKFTVTKTTPGLPATYTITGAAVSGSSGTRTDGFDFAVQVGTTLDPTSLLTIAPVAYGAVTSIIPAAYGQTAPETAGVLFRSEEPDTSGPDAPTSIVLASDYEPQDAESANFLADEAGTAILLTDPTTLSPAVSSVLTDYATIATIYIVGGTSVVSSAIQTQLEAGYTVIRLAGPDQYATNQFVVNYASQNFGSIDPTLRVDYSTEPRYNDTSGSSSPTTTDSSQELNTAIVVSGSADSYQDGVVSGPLSYNENLPVILTTPDSLSAAALSLLTEGEYKQVILLGGPAAVSDSVVDQLTASTDSGGAGVTVFRIAGTDASDTSTRLAEFELDNNDTAFSPYDDGQAHGGALIARGSGFQDALAAGPYAGDNGDTPILLTENATTLGAPLTAYLDQLTDYYGVFAVQAIGGPLSVTPAVQQAAIDAEFSGLSS